MRAFPEAEGFGAEALTAARSLPVAVRTVTNLNNSGAGSFRQMLADCSASNFNIIEFDTGGTIDLSGSLIVAAPYIYIAGQTAPGDGIQIRTGEESFALTGSGDAHNIVVRYLRIRGNSGDQRDCVNFAGGHDIIFDHVSCEWGTDEGLSMSPGTLISGGTDIFNVTIQRSIIAEGLRPHSTGSIIGDDDTDLVAGEDPKADTYQISLHHNIWAHNYHRNPRGSSQDVQIANNVVYNWANDIGEVSRGAKWDIVNNWYARGPLADSVTPWWYYEGCGNRDEEAWPITPSIHISGNIFNAHSEDRTTPNSDQWSFFQHHFTCTGSSYVEGEALPAEWERATPITDAPVPVTLQSAIDAKASVLADVGANKTLAANGTWVDVQDYVDADIITDINAGTGPSTETEIDSPADFGGLPTLAAGTAPTKTDGAVPDAWYTRFYGDSANWPAFDDVAADDYLVIEHYLNGTDPTSQGGGVMATSDVIGHILGVLPPAASAATPDIRVGGSTPAESIPVWDFDAASDEHLDYYCVLEGYDGGGLTIKLKWAASTATTGDVIWNAAIRRIADDAEDLDGAHTYDYNSVTATAPSASGELSYDSITFTDGVDMDSLADGEAFILRIRRDADNASDTMAGDAELLGLAITET